MEIQRKEKNFDSWKPNFCFLWAATVISSVANFLLLLTLSIKIFTSTSSSASSSLVFAAQWVTPIFFTSVIRGVCVRFQIQKLLPLVELSAAIVTVLIGLIYNMSAWFVLALLVIRGVLEGIAKSGRLIAIRLLIPQTHLKSVNPLFNTALPLGTALGALIGAIIINKLSLVNISLVCCVGFVISGCLNAQIKSGDTVDGVNNFQERTMTKEILELFQENTFVFGQFLLLAITTAVFQGYHNVARTVYPLHYLNAGESSVMLLQLLSSVAIILGAALSSIFSRTLLISSVWDIAFLVLTCILMSLILLTKNIYIGFFFYFLYMLMFEISFCKFQTLMVYFCPPDKIATLSSFNTPALPVLMSLIIVIAASSIDKIGLIATTYSLAMLTIVAAVLVYWLLNLRKFSNKNLM